MAETENHVLAERAHRIEDWAEAHFIDPHGIIYSQLDRVSHQPLTPAFFAEDDAVHVVAKPDPAGMYSYENCGMTTGAYTTAMVCRYEVTGDKLALDRARRGFTALRYVYDLGKQLEEGFFPKIYGGAFSDQTSTDQVLYAVTALDRFAACATAAEKAEIASMIGHLVDFWMKRGYRYKYYTVPDMQWPLARFPSLLYLAWKHTGEGRFRAEYERLLAEGVNRYPGESRLRRKRNGEVPPTDFEQDQQAWVLHATADAVTMDVMELTLLLRHDPGNEWADCWRSSVELMWGEGEASLSPDGRVYSHCLVDMATGEPRPLPQSDSAPSLDTPYLFGARSGWSAMIARAAVQAHPHLPEAKRKDACATAQHILQALDIDHLSYLDEPERFAPEHRFLTRFISGDAMANWLWAYWLGRQSDLW